MKKVRRGQRVWHYVATHRRWGVISNYDRKYAIVAYEAGGYEKAKISHLAPASTESIIQFERITSSVRKDAALNRIKRAHKWAKHWSRELV